MLVRETKKKKKKNQPQEVLFIVRKTCFVTLNYWVYTKNFSLSKYDCTFYTPITVSLTARKQVLKLQESIFNSVKNKQTNKAKQVKIKNKILIDPCV